MLPVRGGVSLDVIAKNTGAGGATLTTVAEGDNAGTNVMTVKAENNGAGPARLWLLNEKTNQRGFLINQTAININDGTFTRYFALPYSSGAAGQYLAFDAADSIMDWTTDIHFANTDLTTTAARSHTLSHDMTMDRGNFTISYADNGAGADLYGGTYSNGTQTFGYAITNDLGPFQVEVGMFNTVGGTTSQVIADSNNVTIYTTDGDVKFQRDGSSTLTWDMDDIAANYTYSFIQQTGKIGQSIISFTPASESDATHQQGTVAYDATYLYFKVTDTDEGGSHLWKRIAWGAGGW